jgi:hypothetical protein
MSAIDAKISRIKRLLADMEKAHAQILKGRISKSAVQRVERHRLAIESMLGDKDFAPMAERLLRMISLFREFANEFNAGESFEKTKALQDEIIKEIDEYCAVIERRFSRWRSI